MALQVAEDPVVAEQVEAVADPLHAPPRLVAAVLPLPGVRRQEGGHLVVRQASHVVEYLIVGQGGMRIEGGRSHLELGVGIPVHQGHLGPRLRGEREPGGEFLHARRRLGEVVAPGPAPLGQVHPADEGGDDPAQLGQHPVAVLARLPQRVGSHPQEERLVGLAAGVDAQVGEGGRRQKAAQVVVGAGADGGAVHGVGVGLGLRVPGPVVLFEYVHQPGVHGEEVVESLAVRRLCRRAADLRRDQIAESAAEGPVEAQISGALLQIGSQPAALEDLGQQVRGLFAGQVRAAELGHGVVAELGEHLLVQGLGPGHADRLVLPAEVLGHGGDPDLRDVVELVEEQPPQRAGGTAVAGEQGPFDNLGQVDQGEDRLSGVGEEPLEHRGLGGGELFPEVLQAARSRGSGGRSHGDEVTWV